ncbi:hypothetical protein M1M38_gp077 [Halorubrum tailed virus 27]|uniref:Uncharacterized protein n=1 Tax=Halorubrum tailed virus 27 TaxID=2878008 RepID=A0AAE8XY02_9CAUD|nr:hypothetical protein M1M38_gp077 [Halorubrum tailed virus 27]UBF22770.1 hypothetical protein HRTV-27_gp77 [Halorubrum tailed virus 27]
MIYTEEDMREAFVAGHAAGRYRGRVSAASRLSEFKRKSAESSYDKWRVYANESVGHDLNDLNDLVRALEESK